MSGDCLRIACTWLVSVGTWLTPQPTLSEGLIVNYGDNSYIEGVAEYHGYDLSPYYNRCGIASISPAHLGEIAWLSVNGREWYGPCLGVDVMARHHFYNGVYINQEVAEIPRYIANQFGFENGAWGQVFFGACPPEIEMMQAQPYAPLLNFDDGTERQPLFWPWPEQELPRDCSRWN